MGRPRTHNLGYACYSNTLHYCHRKERPIADFIASVASSEKLYNFITSHRELPLSERVAAVTLWSRLSYRQFHVLQRRHHVVGVISLSATTSFTNHGRFLAAPYLLLRDIPRPTACRRRHWRRRTSLLILKVLNIPSKLERVRLLA